MYIHTYTHIPLFLPLPSHTHIYTVIAARGFKSLEMFGQPDTYVRVEYAGQRFQTEVVPDNEAPIFNKEILSTAGLESEAFVDVCVMEKDSVKDQVLGSMRCEYIYICVCVCV